MGASVFHGAVRLSPFPAWQWQSMIILGQPVKSPAERPAGYLRNAARRA